MSNIIASTAPKARQLTPEEIHEIEHEKLHYPYAQAVGLEALKIVQKYQGWVSDESLLELIFHFDTLEILGIHCFGDQASEIVHIGQAIMSQKGGDNTLRYFFNTTFNYPTMAETYNVAAFDGINRVF